MATIEDQIQTQIANIERSTGRSLAKWFSIVRASGLQKHGQVVAMLKAEHDMGHGNANLIARKALEADAGGALNDEDLIATHYAGKNASLRPVYEAVVQCVGAFGDDVELAPKKTYVSLRRRKQFGQVGPAGGQLEICLNLPGKVPSDRLKAATGMATHRVRITDASGLDDDLVGWLREAYDRA